MNIVVPAHVTNATAYIAAAKARIRANAAKTARKEFFEKYDDAQRIYDWLTHSGEFGPKPVTARAQDQAEFDLMSEGLDYHDLYQLEDRLNVHYKHSEMVYGMFEGDFGSFMMSLRDALYDYGKLSDKQMNAARKAFARKEAWVQEAKDKRAAAAKADQKSEFVGTLKERRKWTLTIRKVLGFDGEWGMTYINIMNDVDGNVIIGKGTKRFGTEGTTVEVTATIVKHDTRDGVKQTFVNRPKFAA